jgi:hypothetical protein
MVAFVPVTRFNDVFWVLCFIDKKSLELRRDTRQCAKIYRGLA